MTLFDHYCARRHTGLGLTIEDARRVRGVIAQAMLTTPGGITDGPFRRGAKAAARAALRAPFELADTATRGALRRRLGRGPSDGATEGIEVSQLEQAIDAALAERDGVLGKAVVAVELNLMAETNPYLDTLLATFDRLYDDAVLVPPKASP